MIEHFFISVVCGISMATILVEKSEDYPIRFISTPFKKILRSILGEQFVTVMDCTVCMSFWTTLICELFLYYLISGHFMWPLSGIAASGISFYTIDFLNTIDKRKE